MIRRNSKAALIKVFMVLVIALSIISCASKQEKVKIPPQKITVVSVEKKVVPIYVEYVGQVYGFKDIPIRARVDGFLEGIHFDEGFNVKKGQLLYSIDAQPYEAEVAARRSQVAEAKTAYAKAKSDLARYKPLAESNAVSQSDLDASVAQYEAAEAGVEAATAILRIAQIQLGYTKIKSPINGLIGKTLAKEGEYVGKSPNPVILNTVSRIDNINVEFFIPENQYLEFARFYIGKDVETNKKRDRDNLELILADGLTHKYPGELNFIDRGVDSNTGAILVQASFPNPDGLIRPGQYAKVKIEIGDEDGYVVVPQRCVKEIQGQYSVFVVNDSNVVESRQIVTGQKVGDYWIVHEGLAKDEKIVIDAMQKVRNGVVIIPDVIIFESKQIN